MSRALAELLAEPPRAAMLPDAILARAEALQAAVPDPAAADRPAAAVAALRARLARCLGLARIPRAEPAWRPLRELAGDGYAVEVGTFEAVPGLVVPALVHRPAGGGPHPAVVHAPGHWMENGRLEPDLQRLGIRLARAGILCLSYDPLGQGERRSGWHTHGQLAPLLAGFTSLGVMVAETQGALDVLAARADVDAARLGLVGASGGGYVSTFTAAVDPRPAAAAICCILNTHVSQLRDAALGSGWDGFTDLCNQVPRLAATAGMGAVVGCAAPCAVTVVHAVDDPPFPLEGARAVVAEAARVYAATGARGRIGLVEVAGGHGLHPAMRDAAAAGLAAALGVAAPAPDAAAELLAHAWPVTHDVASAARPQTTARAAARLPGEALPAPVDTNPVLVALARTAAAALRGRPAPDRGAVARALGGAPAPAVRSRVATNVPLADGVGQRLEIACGGGIVLDAVLLLPHDFGDAAPGVLVTVDEGGKSVALTGPAAAAARARGFGVLAADLRGTGESAASEFELATAAWTLDRDLLALRVDDLRACVAALSARYSTGQQIDKGRIAVHGDGPFGLVALLAAALDDDVAGAAATGLATSLEELLVESPRLTPMAFPFAALETFDLPDLARLAAPRPVLAAPASEDAGAVVGRLLDGLGGAVSDGVVREVADGVFCCEQPDGPRLVREVVIAGDAAALVVDTGLPGAPAAGILPLLARLARRDVVVLLTHPDADHVAGTAEVLAAHPRARVLGGPADLPLLGDPERAIRERYARFSMADDVPFDDAMSARARARFGAPFPTPEPAVDGLALDLGGRTVELVATPGHSPGHTAAVDRAAGVVAAADAAMGRAIRDRDGNAYIPPMYAPPAAYRATLERLAALDARLFASGHEPVLDARATRAFLAESAEACDLVGDLVAAALADAPAATLMTLCARVHAALRDLPPDRVRDLALTVDGHLGELVAAGAAVVEPGPPRRFRAAP